MLFRSDFYYIAVNTTRILDGHRDVSIDKTIPTASVIAKPFIVTVPSIISVTAAIIVVTFASSIAEIARLKPPLNAESIDLPSLYSSLILSNIITFIH